MSSQVVQSVPAGSSAVANGSTLYNGGGRASTGFVALCTGSAGITAGAAELQVSNDQVTWISVPIAVTASTVTMATALGQYQYVRAAITTAVTGGTVGITVQNV